MLRTSDYTNWVMSVMAILRQLSPDLSEMSRCLIVSEMSRVHHKRCSACLIIPLLSTALATAQVMSDQEARKSLSKPVCVSPSTTDYPWVDAKLLRRGASVVVHAIISQTGKVANVEFIRGNANLVP